MANIIKIKRGFTAGTEPVGLTLGELAANLGDGRIFIGGPTGNIIELGSTPVGAALLALPNTFTDTNIFQGVVNIENTTPSNSVSTGALVVYGGVGIQEDLYVQGTIYSNGVPVGSGSVNVPLATSSITGVASFSPTDFKVSALGAVSLTSGLVYSVNGQTGNVTISSLPAVVPLASSSVTGVASFVATDFTVSALGAVSLTSGLVYSVNGQTGNVTVSGVSAVVPLATSSITGVASFGNEFVVSTTGNVSLTGNYVKSFNGSTGAVVYAPPLATTSITGVASFNSTYFSVSSGAVSLASSYQVTGDTVSAGTGISVSRSGNTATITNIGVQTFNGSTGTVVYSPPLATTSVTGVASFNSSDFTVSSGAVSLTNTARTNTANTFTNLQTFNAGLSAQSLNVSQGATFDGDISFLNSASYTLLVQPQTRFEADVTIDGASLSAGGNVYVGNDITLTAISGQVNATTFVQGGNNVLDSSSSVAYTDATNTFSERQIFTTGITGNLSLNSNKITDLLTPTNTYDAANKYYVDSIAAGLNYHPNCHVATTVALGATYDNGVLGVGAYLEALANGFIGQIDGHTADANDRILVKDQTSTVENGIYFVSLTGNASQKWKLIRATDANNSIPGQVAGGDTVYVEMGTTNGGAGFVLVGTSGVGLTLGTSPIIWTQYTGVDVTTAGNGLSKSGNTLNVNVDDSTIQIVGDTLQLVNSSVSVNAGTGLGGGGSVALGSSVTLSNTGVLSFNGSTGNVIGVQSFNGSTGAVVYAPPLATTSVTGVASFNSSDFTVSTGAVSLSNVARTNSANTFTGLQTLNAGLTTQSLFVSQGATFNSQASFTSGLTAANLFVAQGATFNSRASFISGLTTQSLFVAQGATFNGNVQINGNLTVGDAVADTVTMANGQVIKTYTTTTSSVAQTTIASQAAANYSVADVLVQAERRDGTDATVGLQTVRIMIVSNQNGTLSTHTQYANVSTGSSVSTITVNDDGIEWRVRATPASTDSTLFRVYAILYPTYGTAGA